jgi:carbonic anhydrase
MGGNHHLNRRSFLKTTSAAAVTAVVTMAPVGNIAYGAALTKAQRDKRTPDQIIELMKKGNKRFRLGRSRRTITSLSRRRAPSRSSVLADLEKSGAIKVVGATYNLETGVAEFFG